MRCSRLKTARKLQKFIFWTKNWDLPLCESKNFLDILPSLLIGFFFSILKQSLNPIIKKPCERDMWTSRSFWRKPESFQTLLFCENEKKVIFKIFLSSKISLLIGQPTKLPYLPTWDNAHLEHKKLMFQAINCKVSWDQKVATPHSKVKIFTVHISNWVKC